MTTPQLKSAVRDLFLANALDLEETELRPLVLSPYITEDIELMLALHRARSRVREED